MKNFRNPRYAPLSVEGKLRPFRSLALATGLVLSVAAASIAQDCTEPAPPPGNGCPPIPPPPFGPGGPAGPGAF